MYNDLQFIEGKFPSIFENYRLDCLLEVLSTLVSVVKKDRNFTDTSRVFTNQWKLFSY